MCNDPRKENLRKRETLLGQGELSRGDRIPIKTRIDEVIPGASLYQDYEESKMKKDQAFGQTIRTVCLTGRTKPDQAAVDTEVRQTSKTHRGKGGKKRLS